MKIRASKETVILTKEEKAILSKAYEILDDIYDESKCGDSLEHFAETARDNLDDILEDAEVDGGEPSGAVHIVVMM